MPCQSGFGGAARNPARGRRDEEEGRGRCVADVQAQVISDSDEGKKGKDTGGLATGPVAPLWAAARRKEGRCTGGPRVGRGGFGPSGQTVRKKGDVVFLFFSFSFNQKPTSNPFKKSV